MSRMQLHNDQIKLGACPADKASAIREAGDLLLSSGMIAPAYIDSLMRRENVSNTFLGHGVAIPHGMIEDRHLILRTGIALLQIPGGLEWNAGHTVHLVVAIAAQSDEHIQVLRRLTRLLQDEAQLQRLFTCTDPALLIASLSDETAPATPAPAAHDLEQAF